MAVDKNEISTYRLKRADETFDEALILFENGRLKGCVNRLYYTCFYAVMALLAYNDIQCHTHNGAKTLFHKQFLANGKISNEIGLTYNRLFSIRQFGDYDDFYEISSDYIQKFLPEVKQFLNTVKDLVNK